MLNVTLKLKLSHTSQYESKFDYQIIRKRRLNDQNGSYFFKFDHESWEDFHVTTNFLLMKNTHFLSVSSSNDKILQFGSRTSFSKIIFLFIVPLKLKKGLKAFHFYNRFTLTKFVKKCTYFTMSFYKVVLPPSICQNRRL